MPGTRQARSWQAPAQTSTAGYGNAGASGGDHPFATLRGFNFRDMVVIDPMHTIGGVAKDLVDLLLYDKDIVSINVQDHERTVNNRDFGTTYRASESSPAFTATASQLPRTRVLGAKRSRGGGNVLCPCERICRQLRIASAQALPCCTPCPARHQ